MTRKFGDAPKPPVAKAIPVPPAPERSRVEELVDNLDWSLKCAKLTARVEVLVSQNAELRAALEEAYHALVSSPMSGNLCVRIAALLVPDAKEKT